MSEKDRVDVKFAPRTLPRVDGDEPVDDRPRLRIFDPDRPDGIPWAAPVPDAEFLAMLATDTDVLDTTPAEAIKGDVARMPALATAVVQTAYPGFGEQPFFIRGLFIRRGGYSTRRADRKTSHQGGFWRNNPSIH